MESPLVAILLDSAVSWDDFLGWLDALHRHDTPRDLEADGDETAEEAPAFEIPESVSGRFSGADLKLMRPEIGLAVINFLRDQITSILDENPNSFPTPAKAAKASAVTPAAKKYDYRSPVKAMGMCGKTGASAASNNRGGRVHGNKHSQRSLNAGGKRAQLFEVGKDVHHPTFGANTNDALSEMPNNHTICALEERCNGPGRTWTGAGGGANFLPGKSSGRRSLGPEFERSNAAGKGRTHSQMSLADFLTPPAKTGKQKKKGRASAVAHPDADSQHSETYTIKTRKTKSLSPTAVNRAATAGGHVKIPTETTSAVLANSQPLAKVTEEYKAQFDNANIWSQIAREFRGQGERVSGELSSINTKNISSASLSSSTSQSSNDALVSADPALVTNKLELDKLVKLYSLCIDLNLVPNVLDELYLMLELLTVQERSSKSTTNQTNKMYLNNVHNCVYFACEVLLQEAGLLENLNKVTLDLLSDIPRIDLFSPTLNMTLSEARKRKQASSRSRRQSSNTFLESVRFMPETDSNTNFATDRDFQDFKKQRDLFYEILRTWQGTSDQSDAFGRSFQDRFGDSVARLVSMNCNPVNLHHLARLVRDQMVNSCLSEFFEKSGEGVSMLGRPMDRVKLGRLQSRIEPQGAQAFFRDLIQCSSNSYSFLTHLKGALCEAIEKGNSESFAIEEDMRSGKRSGHQDDHDNDIAASVSVESFSLLNDIPAMICKLRILGKFFGFIDSLPFRYHSDALSGVVLDSQVRLRERMLPANMDLMKFLSEGLRYKRLVITLPWIVELCSALDPISLRTKQYLRVLEAIVDIYKAVLPAKDALYEVDPLNAFLLKLSCGWLFENPVVPRELFFNDRDRARLRLEEMISSAEGGGIGSVGIDDKPVISSDLLYACCPFLSELKRVLSLFKSGTERESGFFEASRLLERGERNIAIRKKRLPLSKSDGNTSSSTDSDINSILENQFFHNLHERDKRCVDLVSGCIYSAVISAVEKEFLRSEVKKMSSVIKDRISAALSVLKINDDFDEVEGEHMRQQLVREAVGNMAAASVNAVRKATRARLELEADTYKDVLIRLLSDSSVKDHLRRVTMSMASAKLKEWARTKITQEYFAKKYEKKANEYWSSEREKGVSAYSRGQLMTSDASKTPLRMRSLNEERIVQPDKTVATLLIGIKALICALHDGLRAPSSDEMILLLSEVETCVRDTPVMPDHSKRDMGSLTVSLAIALLASHPNSMNSDLQMSFVGLWQRVLPHPEELSAIICPVTLSVLQRATRPKSTWDKMEALLTRLLKHELLFPIPFENQIVILLREDWNPDLLSRLGSCLRGTIDSHLRSGGGDASSDFTELLGWIIRYFSEAKTEIDMDEFPVLF